MLDNTDLTRGVGVFKHTVSGLGVMQCYPDLNLCPRSFSIDSILLQ